MEQMQIPLYLYRNNILMMIILKSNFNSLVCHPYI